VRHGLPDHDDEMGLLVVLHGVDDLHGEPFLRAPAAAHLDVARADRARTR